MSRARRDDVDVIELLDADPSVFVGATLIDVAHGTDPEPERRPARRAAPAWSIGMAVVVMVAAAGSVVWSLHAWRVDDRVFVRDQPATLANTPDDRLVIGGELGAPHAAYLGASATATSAMVVSITGGAVFVGRHAATITEPSAMYYYRIANGSSLADNPPTPTSDITVQGMPGTIWRGPTDVLVSWQLPDGSHDNLRAPQGDETAAIHLADNLSMDAHGTVVVHHRSALGTLHPVGTLHDLQIAGATFEAASAWTSDPTSVPPATERTTNAIFYSDSSRGDVSITVGSGTNSNAAELLRAELPVRAVIQVHGHDALVVAIGVEKNDPNAPNSRTVVTWAEGHHTIAVAADTQALAEQYAKAVRLATETEWAKVQAVSQTTTAQTTAKG